MPESVLDDACGAFDVVGSLAVIKDDEGGLIIGSSPSELEASFAAGFVFAVTKEETLSFVELFVFSRPLTCALGFDFTGVLVECFDELGDLMSDSFCRFALLEREEILTSSSSSSSSSTSSGCGKLDP